MNISGPKGQVVLICSVRIIQELAHQIFVIFVMFSKTISYEKRISLSFRNILDGPQKTKREDK